MSVNDHLRHNSLAWFLSLFALMAQLLSPMVHAGMQARGATNPLLASFCGPASPEMQAKIKSMVPAGELKQLQQDHLNAERLCDIACATASQSAPPPMQAVTFSALPAHSRFDVAHPRSAIALAIRARPPATGPPA